MSRALSPPRAPSLSSLETLKLYASGPPTVRVNEAPATLRIAMAPAGLPDWDDLGRTTFDATPFALEQDRDDADEPTPIVPYDNVARGKTEADARAGAAERGKQPASHVRVRARAEIPFDAMRVLDAVGEAQLQLTLDIFCLESAIDGVPYDPSARAAEGTLRTRVQEIADLRDALNEVYLEGSNARAALLFTPGRPLAAYVRGLYVWAGSVVATLTTLAAGLRTLTPDWLTLRRELASAAAWYFDGLVPAIREDVPRVGDPDVAAKIDELIWAASLVWQGLDKKFG